MTDSSQGLAGSSGTPATRIASWFTLCFFLSGASALVYQVVWTRHAMALFGVTTPNLALVVSIFMLGLAIGSWGGARFGKRSMSAHPGGAIALYGICEALIGIGALTVKPVLLFGRSILDSTNTDWASPGFTAAGALCMIAAFLPWTTCMGATTPLAMAGLRAAGDRRCTGFSLLYLANVLGAVAGTICSALILVERFGLIATQGIAIAANILIAAGCLLLASRIRRSDAAEEPDIPAVAKSATTSEPAAGSISELRLMLFVSGCVGLAAEVVWTRLYIPYLHTSVYAYAAVLATYLASTYAGSVWCRCRADRTPPSPSLWLLLASTFALSLVGTDLRVDDLGLRALRLLALVPPCFLMGWLTPRLVDLASGGDPRRAGECYAVNICGSILGPLLAGFILLPWFGERASLAILALAMAASVAIAVRARLNAHLAPIAASLLAIGLLVAFTMTPYDRWQQLDAKVRVVRDHTATTVARGAGTHRELLVNGVGMTVLTPVCKVMVHVPLAMRAKPAGDVLIICFGMGTAFRSSVAWTDRTTCAELVPGVYTLFPFYHDDAEALTEKFRDRLIVDDGRRFLERTRKKYDLIVIDPAPPISSIGSSLLYSRQFMRAAKDHLTEDGIMAHWIPSDVPADVVSSVVQASRLEFAHLKVYRSLGGYGWHIFGSLRPIPEESAEVLAARLPEHAAKDCLEWNTGDSVASMIADVLSRRCDIADLIDAAPPIPPMDDDRPVNEYYLLRRWGWR